VSLHVYKPLANNYYSTQLQGIVVCLQLYRIFFRAVLDVWGRGNMAQKKSISPKGYVEAHNNKIGNKAKEDESKEGRNKKFFQLVHFLPPNTLRFTLLYTYLLSAG